MSKLVIWNSNRDRIWWACPTCKIEAGITLPASVTEVVSRVEKFTSTHSICAEPITAPQWRKES